MNTGPADYILFVDKRAGDLLEKLTLEQSLLVPLHVWRTYDQLEKATGQPKNELIAL